LALPKPDASRFIAILMGRLMSARPPLVEYLVDAAVMKPIVTELLGRVWTDYGGERESQTAFLDNFIAFWHGLGYDIVRFEQGLPFAENQIYGYDATSAADR